VIDVQTSSAEAQLIERKQAPMITDNMGAVEMRENGDSDAAAAMTRVTGLSVVDDFVFVRGLGERYSNTTLNGAVIPTTEPDRKVVPLDLFPTGLIDNVKVAKSFSPDQSAEFAGGLVQIEPLKFPTGPTVDISYSVGFNSQTSGQDVLGYTGGGRDWLGFDDGTRDLPGSFPNRKVIRGGRFTPDVGLLRSELETIGESFDNSQWTPVARTGKPNQRVSALLGSRFGRFGTLVSVTQSYNEQLTEDNQIFFVQGAGGLEEFNNYDFQTGSTRAQTGLVGNLAHQFSSNHRLSLENFYTHAGRDEARTYEGFNSDVDANVRNTRVYWIEEGLLSNNLSGDHFIRTAGNSSIDWRVSYAKADRDEPDLREALYHQEGNTFVLADESQSGFRMFNTLDDTTLDVAANWSLMGTQWQSRPVQYKFGLSYVERERDFTSRRFRYVPIPGIGDANLFPGTMDLTDAPEELFTAANIGRYWEFREETRATDAYDAQQEVLSFYAMTDLSLGARTRIVAGARVEQFDQQVNTFDLFDFEGDPDVITGGRENTDIFPSVNLVQALTPQTNLRVSYSQTVNRPEFRELAPFEFTDVVGGRATVGNPDLERALIQNVDVRIEAFPGGDQVLAASVFYKHFDRPIERVVQATAQLRTSFANADSAQNFGVELEARQRVNDALLVGANYTFVDSSITLDPVTGVNLTSSERPLAGQSRSLFNAMAEVGNANVSARVLYNFFGERLSDVGSFGIPDIYEDGRGQLDLVVSTRWRAVSVRLTGENLTDEDFAFIQGGLDQRVYRLGRTFGISFGLSPF
jgi:TonB-dependent receptor